MVNTSRASHWGTIFRKKLRDELAPVAVGTPVTERPRGDPSRRPRRVQRLRSDHEPIRYLGHMHAAVRRNDQKRAGLIFASEN